MYRESEREMLYVYSSAILIINHYSALWVLSGIAHLTGSSTSTGNQWNVYLHGESTY